MSPKEIRLSKYIKTVFSVWYELPKKFESKQSHSFLCGSN